MVTLGTSNRAVVLASGGLDSTVTAALAREAGHELLWLTVDYGQRHGVEVARARQVAAAMHATKHTVLSVNLRALGGSAGSSASHHRSACVSRRRRRNHSQGFELGPG